MSLDEFLNMESQIVGVDFLFEGVSGNVEREAVFMFAHRSSSRLLPVLAVADDENSAPSASRRWRRWRRRPCAHLDGDITVGWRLAAASGLFVHPSSSFLVICSATACVIVSCSATACFIVCCSAATFSFRATAAGASTAGACIASTAGGDFPSAAGGRASSSSTNRIASSATGSGTDVVPAAPRGTAPTGQCRVSAGLDAGAASARSARTATAGTRHAAFVKRGSSTGCSASESVHRSHTAAATTFADSSASVPAPPNSGGLSSGATAAVVVVVVVAFMGFAGMLVCLSQRRKRRRAERYYPGFAVPSYTPQHMSGEAPFLGPPSAPGSMNFSSGQNQSMSQMASGQAYGQYQSQQRFTSANYSTGSQGPARSVPSSGDLSVGNTKAFTFDELYDITGGFARDKLLGEGGFGCVFKGSLADGKVVAVKQLKSGGGQGEREFQAEVEIISRVHHRHLVSLVGYCIAEDHRLLVYDFVSNDTLHHHLHGSSLHLNSRRLRGFMACLLTGELAGRGRSVMDWPTRVKIAAGSARGLAYLHEDCKKDSVLSLLEFLLLIAFHEILVFIGHPRIIHRDIKSSNILLDEHFEAQVADFGLARLAEKDVTHVSTRVMGTFGYLAPEYASTGKLTEKSDVFSFGVVLLELITGRKPVDSSRPLGDESLVEWSRPLLSSAIENQEFDELVDPRLDGNYDDVEMFRVIEAAAACIRHSSARRPKMGQVVRVLDSLTDVDLSNGVPPGKSQMFNVANTADIRQFQRMAFGSQDFSSEYSQSRSSMGSRREF
ncbi:hypothetical protein ABZP36_021707 [Zizania latifolia]